MENRTTGRSVHWLVLPLLTFATVIFSHYAFAQSGLEGRVTEVINDLVRIINILIVGFIAWAGFLIARGDGSGMNRLIYGVIGLVVTNGANLIINYFR